MLSKNWSRKQLTNTQQIGEAEHTLVDARKRALTLESIPIEVLRWVNFILDLNDLV